MQYINVEGRNHIGQYAIIKKNPTISDAVSLESPVVSSQADDLFN